MALNPLNIFGAIVGGIGGRKAAQFDRAQIDEMNEKNNRFFEYLYPKMTKNIDRVEGDFDKMYETGAYTGDMFAPANERMRNTTDQMYNFGQDQFTTGNRLMDENAGFGQNNRDLYANFTDLANRGTAMFDANAARDPMADASAYAQSNMSPIVKAMMRDDRRALEEGTLPTIGMNASNTGNTNSSRAGVASAIARRAFDDRKADVSTDVFNSLRDAKLAEDAAKFGRGLDAIGAAGSQFGNAGTANRAISDAYRTGIDAAATGLNTSFGAASNDRRFDQEQLDADKALFDYNTGYNYNLGKDFGGFLSGSRMPVQADYKLNAVSPMAGMLGGAQAGYGAMNQLFPNAGGFGGDLGYNLSHSIGSAPIFDSFFPKGNSGMFNLNFGGL